MRTKLLTPEQRKQREFQQAAGDISGLARRSNKEVHRIAQHCASAIIKHPDTQPMRGDRRGHAARVITFDTVTAAPWLPGSDLKIGSVWALRQKNYWGVGVKLRRPDGDTPGMLGTSLTIGRTYGGKLAVRGNDKYQGPYDLSPLRTPKEEARFHADTYGGGGVLIASYGERHETALTAAAAIAVSIETVTGKHVPLERTRALFDDWATVLGQPAVAETQQLWRIHPPAELGALLVTSQPPTA